MFFADVIALIPNNEEHLQEILDCVATVGKSGNGGLIVIKE